MSSKPPILTRQLLVRGARPAQGWQLALQRLCASLSITYSVDSEAAQQLALTIKGDAVALGLLLNQLEEGALGFKPASVAVTFTWPTAPSSKATP
ncbi:hypothetical protein [Chitinimonas sp.]|uniref:hypothetical protein n=1 Tax=Chitinimonas sp. TaxID=1934313 RepID=UPI002F925C67